MSGSGGSTALPGLEEALRQALEPDQVAGSVVTLATERGARRWEVRVVPGRTDAGGAGMVVAVAREVTHTERTETERLHRSALAELGAALFHDLRGPLATIRSFLGFLTVDLQERDETRIATDVESIRKAVDRMDDVLTHAAKRTRATEGG
jgi:nitrogen-specific signal transduction histidine kinase